MLQVSFPDHVAWQPLRTLELVGSVRLDPLSLLQGGRLGTVDDLRRTLTQVRLTGRLADMVYSMEATNTDFYAYQYKPVLKVLRSPVRGLLIADEVGLGKTIEAGLIWTELRSRYDMRRLLVLCPAALREKWVDELRSRFGVAASICGGGDVLDTLEAAQRGDEPEFAMVASLQGLRPPRDWQAPTSLGSTGKLARFLDDNAHEAPIVDLLIVDEAHHMRNPRSQTHALGRLFRAISDHMLLLSATPVHNRSLDLQALLGLLDPDTFYRPEFFERILEANAPLVRARDGVIAGSLDSRQLDALLAEAGRAELLRDNRQLALLREQRYDDDALRRHAVRSDVAYRLENVNLLGHVLTRTRKRDVTEWRVVREPYPEFVTPSEIERRIYDIVTAIVVRYCHVMDQHERFLLVTPQKQMASCMAAALRWWQDRADLLDGLGEDAEGADVEEIGNLTAAIAREVESLVCVEELEANDTKYDRLREILARLVTEGEPEKVIVFSSFRRTLTYLERRLAEDGIATLVLMGGQRETKQEMVSRFRDPAGPHVLLSSEVGAEGVDMQFSRVVINYDLPWNPMRVEQRIGRVDRLGQTAEKVLVWNIFHRDTIDARVYTRLYDKLDLCRHALGDFEAVLGDQIRELTADLLGEGLTPKQQEARIDQTALALENLRKEASELEARATHLTAYGDYILNQIRAARDMHRWIDGADLFAYTRDFLVLHHPGFELREVDRDALIYDLRLPPRLKAELSEFIQVRRLQGTALIRNSAGAVRCRFESKVVASGSHRVETISQFHPLVRFVSHRVAEEAEQLRPAVAMRVPAATSGLRGLAVGLYIVCVQLWSVRGLQVVERLGFAGGRIAPSGGSVEALEPDLAERLVVAGVMSGETWLEARGRLDLEMAHALANEHLFADLEEGYSAFVGRLEAENEDRATLQTRNLERHLEDNLEKLETIRLNHLAVGREALAKATAGRMESLRRSVATELAKVDLRRRISSHSEDIAIAIVEVSP